MTSATAGPDFVCIGSQKAGTTWLFDQLLHHDQFWMPPVKELHYFDRVFPDKGLRRLVAGLREDPAGAATRWRDRHGRALEPRDYEFIRFADSCAGKAADLRTYAALFAFKGAQISGDITPAYSTLALERIQGLAAQFPRLKVLLLLRDPVERFWSQLSMAWRRGHVDKEIAADWRGLREYLESPAVRGRSFATATFRAWSQCFPQDQIRYWFLEDVSKTPNRSRQEVLEYLGADPNRPSGALAPAYDRKAGAPKLAMPEATRDSLSRYFANELLECAELFGGPARDWPKRYGF